MKTDILTQNEMRFTLALRATWAVLHDPILTTIYYQQWIRSYPRPLSVSGKELTLYGYVFNVLYAAT